MANNERYPEDTDKLLHIIGESTITGILQQAEDKWPGILLEELKIEPVHVQVRSFGYDLYDSDDYANILIVSPTEEHFTRMAAKISSVG